MIDQALRRKLLPRQLTMIAIGGSVGTGLFLASGLSIHQAGPGGALLAYLLMGILVYFLMMSLGEMASYRPSTGSFYTYAADYVNTDLAFALGVNYWFNWAVTLAAELAAASLVMKFWFPEVSALIWSGVFLGFLFFVNIFSVRVFGEVEYGLSWIKVLVILVFIALGLMLIARGPQFQYWHHGDAPFHGGFLAVMGVFLIAGFGFQGSELVGIAAGESDQPQRNIPKAIRMVFWRIMIFYLLTIAVIGLLIPYDSPQLEQTEVITSPFTWVFQQVGLPYAASFVNFTILVAILSAGNSSMYAASRMLWHLSTVNRLPLIFSRLNKRGAPYVALIATALIGMLTFMSSRFGDGDVYVWLLSASGLSGFITWLGIAICHYQFRRRYLAGGGRLESLPFRAKFFPFGPIFALVICVIVMLGQEFSPMMQGELAWQAALMTYGCLVLFFLALLGSFLMRALRVPRQASKK
jgi:lysine-specific permease